MACRLVNGSDSECLVVMLLVCLSHLTSLLFLLLFLLQSTYQNLCSLMGLSYQIAPLGNAITPVTLVWPLLLNLLVLNQVPSYLQGKHWGKRWVKSCRGTAGDVSDSNPGLCHNGSISLSARKFPRSNKFTLGLHWMQNWSDCRSHRESMLGVCVPAHAPSAAQSVCALHIHLLPFSASSRIGLRMPQQIGSLWNKKVNHGVKQFWTVCLVRALVWGKEGTQGGYSELFINKGTQKLQPKMYPVWETSSLLVFCIKPVSTASLSLLEKPAHTAHLVSYVFSCRQRAWSWQGAESCQAPAISPTYRVTCSFLEPLDAIRYIF